MAIRYKGPLKGFILAAGLGTRLKPWTEKHPKALVPVGGVPMLERVIENMYSQGVTDITINVHHFADQIIEFISSKGWDIKISDERERLLDTGGALLHAADFLEGDRPILVHNVDILSNADFNDIMNIGSDASLLVSDRSSTRKLIFDDAMQLRGWHNLVSDEYKPVRLSADSNKSEDLKSYTNLKEFAFGGIYIISSTFIGKMRQNGWGNYKFSIIDYFLDTMQKYTYTGRIQKGLEIIDIGKPDSLNRANKILSFLKNRF